MIVLLANPPPKSAVYWPRCLPIGRAGVRAALRPGLDQPVALLEVDNAAARNALSGKMMAELRGGALARTPLPGVHVWGGPILLCCSEIVTCKEINYVH